MAVTNLSTRTIDINQTLCKIIVPFNEIYNIDSESIIVKSRHTRESVTEEVGDADAPATPIGSLSRGIRIVETLLGAPAPLGLSDVAAASALDNATAHRLLKVLIEHGYVVRDDATKRYMPGPRGLAPLEPFHPLNELRREAASLLQLVRNQTGETTALILFIGLERLIVEVSRGKHPLAPYYDTWLRSPLHGSASGKILLAHRDPNDRKRVLGPGPYPAVTSATITNADVLARHLTEVAQKGVAIARGESFVGLSAVAVPLFAVDVLAGCLVVTGSNESFPKSRDAELHAALKSTAELLAVSAPSLRAMRHMFGYSNGSASMRAA